MPAEIARLRGDGMAHFALRKQPWPLARQAIERVGDFRVFIDIASTEKLILRREEFPRGLACGEDGRNDGVKIGMKRGHA